MFPNKAVLIRNPSKSNEILLHQLPFYSLRLDYRFDSFRFVKIYPCSRGPSKLVEILWRNERDSQKIMTPHCRCKLFPIVLLTFISAGMISNGTPQDAQLGETGKTEVKGVVEMIKRWRIRYWMRQCLLRSNYYRN